MGNILREIEQDAKRATEFGKRGARPSHRWVPVDIDLQAYVTLWLKANPDERVNDVIRRLAGLGPRQR